MSQIGAQYEPPALKSPYLPNCGRRGAQKRLQHPRFSASAMVEMDVEIDGFWAFILSNARANKNEAGPTRK